MAPGPASSVALLACFSAQLTLLYFSHLLSGTDVQPPPPTPPVPTSGALTCPVVAPCSPPGHSRWELLSAVVVAFLAGAGSATLALGCVGFRLVSFVTGVASGVGGSAVVRPRVPIEDLRGEDGDRAIEYSVDASGARPAPDAW